LFKLDYVLSGYAKRSGFFETQTAKSVLLLWKLHSWF